MPANDWEWYILSQLQTRFNSLEHPLKEAGADWSGGFMTAPRCYTFTNGAVIISKLQKMGTLLDLVNLTKNADKGIIEPIAIYLTAELLGLMELLHSVNIVHADLKPDNFLVRHTPSTQSSPSLQLIDFGKAIDIQLESVDQLAKRLDLSQANGGEGVQADQGGQDASASKNVGTVDAAAGEAGKGGGEGENVAANIESQAEKVDDAAEAKGDQAKGDQVKVDHVNGGGEKGKDEVGRTGKYHLDYFGIAGRFKKKFLNFRIIYLGAKRPLEINLSVFPIRRANFLETLKIKIIKCIF